MKIRIGVILEFGFHDLKKYIYSPLGKKLAEHFDIVWLAIQKNSEEFHRLFSETGYPISYFDQNEFIGPSRTEARNISVRRAWMSRKNLGQFHNYNFLRIKWIKSILLGNGLMKRSFEKWTLKQVEARYQNKKIETILNQYNIKIIFSSGYASSFAKSVFVTSKKIGASGYLLINNWKDLYISNFIPLTFLAGIFVWDENMKFDYLFHMPYLNPDRIIVSGNPVFDNLKESKPKFDRLYYSKKYKIYTDTQWIYYTMMSPLASINEIDIVKLIGNELLRAFGNNKFVILLRRNPQHNESDFQDEIFPENVILTEHFSYFDRVRDMHTQSPEGEQEWIDLLHHCAINMSVPSTVTLEFLTLAKPVINIGFGSDGEPEKKLRQHFEAGFYKPLFKDKRIKRVEKLSDLLAAIADCKIKSSFQVLPQKQKSAADIIIQRLLEDVTE